MFHKFTVPGFDSGEKKLCKMQKIRGKILGNAEKWIDKRKRMVYNGSPYCVSMPICAHSHLHGHNSTENGGCQGVTCKKSQNRQLALAYQKHTIRKKGCDDLYGNGQGRNVRQDHA